VLDTDFLLIEGDWPSTAALGLLKSVSARWTVIHRVRNGGDLYYVLLSAAVANKLLDGDERPVGEALQLSETHAAPIRAAGTEAAEGLGVMVSRGLVAGVTLGTMKHTSGQAVGNENAKGAARPSRGGTRSKAYVGGDKPSRSSFDLESSRFLAPGSSSPVALAVEASAPPQVGRGKTVLLSVNLTSDVSKRGTLPVVGNIGDSIEVVINASAGLGIVGRSDGELKIAKDGSAPLQFIVQGVSIGRGVVSVYVFRQRQGVGSIDVLIEVVDQPSGGAPTTTKTSIAPAIAKIPDLQLLVLEGPKGYTMRLSAADPALQLNLKMFGPVELPKSPDDYFKSFYADVEDILTSPAEPAQKIQRLATKGDYLFSTLVPAPARELLWKLLPRIASIHVQSEEPWIPWELIKLSGDDGAGAIVDGGFLCEEFEMTRWIPGLGYFPKLALNDIGVVTPADSGLIAAEPEKDTLFELAHSQGLQAKVIEAEEVALRQALANGTFDAIHFTGHGRAGAVNADRAEIELTNKSRLRPEDLTGVVANLGRKGRHPLVFLNACEIGRAGIGLNVPGGWPRGFLAAGAGAFIAPFWKVLDRTAASFAESFYRGLLAGDSAGKAARDARKLIKAASDPTWLAYSVYAHADARLDL
jgi:hypothetical protein